MSDIIIVMIVFGSGVLISITAILTDHKQKMYESELRLQEMRMGYPPGTYSKGKRRKSSKSQMEATKEFVSKQNSDLEREIDDLLTRIDNIETIRRNKNENWYGILV